MIAVILLSHTCAQTYPSAITLPSYVRQQNFPKKFAKKTQVSKALSSGLSSGCIVGTLATEHGSLIKTADDQTALVGLNRLTAYN
jgi:hypothetical protein